MATGYITVNDTISDCVFGVHGFTVLLSYAYFLIDVQTSDVATTAMVVVLNGFECVSDRIEYTKVIKIPKFMFSCTQIMIF